MSGQGFSFMEKEQKRFISYLLESKDTLVRTELEMLKNNDISGILPVSEIHDNGSVSLLYNITSKQQFSQRMSGVFNGVQLHNMLESICKMLLLLDEYMINPGHLIFNMEYMCFDYEKEEVEFVVLPLKDTEETADIHSLLINIFRKLQYSDNTLMEFPAYIYDYINSNLQINAKEFNSYLEDTYNSLCGIIQPSDQVPEALVANYSKEREIVDTEEVKKTVQSRFITQNEKIVEFEAIEENSIKNQQVQKTGQENVPLQEITPGSFSVPAPKGAFNTPPAKERKRKEKPVKKVKEKPIKEVKAKPVKEVKEKPVKEKKKDKPKEKKGLFGFGKKNKKENSNEANTVPQPPIIQPVNGVNNARVPVPPQPPVPLPAAQPYINSPQQVQGQPYLNGMQQPYTNGIQGTPVQNWQVQQVQTPQPPVWTAPKQNEKVSVGNTSLPCDPDATMILPSGEDSLDSTVLLGMADISIPKPALRSRVTGEVIKIERPGFIIGRNKMLNGRFVEMPEGKRPDVSINIKSISHTHAVFLWHDSKWYIQDKNSLNGTFVNGQRVSPSEERELNEGDIVCFASEEYEYIIVK